MEAARRYAPYALIATLVALGCALLGEPIGRNASHTGRMWLAGLGVLIVLGWAGASGLVGVAATRARAGLRGLMTAAVVVGAFNYYQFDPKVLRGLGDSVDITYYYVNSKFFHELGYFRLYPAMLQADREASDHHSSKIRNYRDLRDYDVKPVAVAYEHAKQIKAENFSPQRWEAFKHDVDWLLDPSMKSTRTMQSNFYVDHGYNPPPTWTVVGGALANLVPVEQVKLIASVDGALVLAMLVGVGWAFGFDVALFAALFFVCTFSGRWPILGEALLRFDWLAALTLSMCFARKGWWAVAGGLLSYAAFNRVFPAIFFLGWGIVALIDTVRARRIQPRDLRFVGGAAAVGAALIGTALLAYGPGAFRESAANLSMHNRSFSSHRVGLGDLVLFRGEQTRAEMARTVYTAADGKVTKGIAAKELKIHDMQPWLRLTAAAAVAFLALYAARARRRDGSGVDVWELMPLAILPFYCATNPQINYYNLRILLYVWHGWAVATGTGPRAFHHAALGVLFAGEAATQSAFLTRVEGGGLAERYYVTSTTSVWMGIYLILLSGWLGWQGWFTGPPASEDEATAPPTPAPV